MEFNAVNVPLHLNCNKTCCCCCSCTILCLLMVVAVIAVVAVVAVAVISQNSGRLPKIAINAYFCNKNLLNLC